MTIAAQDRELLFRQFNFTQQNHKILILIDCESLPVDDDHNIFFSGLLIVATTEENCRDGDCGLADWK